jgi:hypothetical protein
MKIFFQIYFMSVDDVVGLTIMNDFEQLDMALL